MANVWWAFGWETAAGERVRNRDRKREGRKKMRVLLHHHLRFALHKPHSPKLPTPPSPSSLQLRVESSKNDSSGSNQTGDDDPSTDWDKAWARFKKKGKRKNMFSQFTPDKYVTWNPRRAEYPLDEEIDPIKKTERTNLMLWTSPRFTLGLAIIIVTLLLIYTIMVPQK